MNKKQQKLLEESLSKAIAPKGKNKAHLDDLLKRYGDEVPTPSTPLTPVTGLTPVAPVKNFQKVPNSITKEAIPQGLFKTGKAKQLWDVLYSLTRGAIKPVRVIQIGKPELMRQTGISTMSTLNANILNLQLVGLLKVTIDSSGQHNGNIYEVFTPDELTPSTPLSPADPPQPRQETTPVIPLETDPPQSGLSVDSIRYTAEPKTILKTRQTFDDDRARVFDVFLSDVAAIKGRELTAKDFDDAEKLNRFLIELLTEIAANTKDPINAPFAILKTHIEGLRHRETVASRKQATGGKERKETTPEQQKEIACGLCDGAGKRFVNGEYVTCSHDAEFEAQREREGE